MDNNNDSVYDSDKEEFMKEFKEKIKQHLSNEYIYTMEKKDELENQLVQLNSEKSQINRSLFPSVEHKNIRKYFSPLNIKEDEISREDRNNNDLDREIAAAKDAIDKINTSLSEIKEFLYNIDRLFYDVTKESSYEDSYPQIGDNFTNNVDFLSEERIVYPQMLRNLYNISDYIMEKYNNIEVLIEFNDHNIETSEEVNRNLLNQIDYNIKRMIEDYDLSSIMIQGEITSKSIEILINYLCDNEEINDMSVKYSIEYL